MNIDRIYDVSIPLHFNGDQPNAFGVEPAVAKAVEVGEFIGDTRRGGSVNFEQYTFIPHCNGTHTECVGHITDERISVRDCLQDVLISALLLTVAPENAIGCNEMYSGEFAAGDRVVTRRQLSRTLESRTEARALIIRTLPNVARKLTAVYGDEIPPYFTNDGMELIVECGIKHLLVDLPSIDRLYDEGKLTNHRIFWNLANGSKSIDKETRINSTITELIYVPDEVADGEYLLNLQIAPFDADCAPSRPILIRQKPD